MRVRSRNNRTYPVHDRAQRLTVNAGGGIIPPRPLMECAGVVTGEAVAFGATACEAPARTEAVPGLAAPR